MKGTTSGDKNELLFSRFGINYNDTPRRFRKGTTLYRARPAAVALPEPPRSLLQGASKGGDDKDAPQDGCTSVDDADNAEGSVPKGRANEKTPVVVASANEKKRPVVASANENKPVVASANENKPVMAPINEKKQVVVTSANEKGPVVGSGPFDKSTQGARCVGSAPEPQVGIENTVGKYGALKGEPRIEEIRNAIENAKPPQGEVVKVTSGAGAVKLKRLLKKGHAPPGTIEEDACDLIRTDFWDRNPHILSGIARR